MTKLSWDKFEPQFGTWASKVKPFFDSGGFDPIYEFLKFESKRGRKIAPISELTFRCFRETDMNNTNCIILSMCPYHSHIKGTIISDGLAFGCSTTNILQPSLNILYSAWEKEFDKEAYRSPDLSYLSKQGILLLNSALTTEIGKAGNHLELWKPFTKYLFEEVFAYTGIPIIMMGKDAQFYDRYVTPLTHGPLFKIEHPSFAARENRDMDTKGAFKAVTTIVKQNNGINLNWLMSKEDIDLQDIPF